MKTPAHGSALERTKRRRRSRGISQVGAMIEVAATLGWFVIVILGEKYMDDSIRARRATETASAASSVTTAAGYCMPGPSLEEMVVNPVNEVRQDVQMLETGLPEMAKAAIPAIIMGLGIGSLRTLPLYSMPFRASHAVSTAASVSAPAPLDFNSGEFKGERSVACIERSLDLPGAPWPVLRLASTGVYVTNILGYL